MRILVLGAYGLVGQSVVRELCSAGHQVIGLSRRPEARRLLPERVSWVSGDLNSMVSEAHWTPLLDGVDAVVNASGALQTGLGDDLAAVQRDAIVALVAACEEKGLKRFVQISAPGASPDASTEFFSTKGEADRALRASRLSWVILKPGLVISPTAYGGTGLLRMLAAVPLLQPIFLGEAQVQTVAADEVGQAVVLAVERSNLSGHDFDLVEADPHRLAWVVQQFRRWLGFREPGFVIQVPDAIGLLCGRAADVAGWFGWRSPLRSTALKVLGEGVRGDPLPWRAATGQTLRPLDATLRMMASTRQERIFARTQLVFPVLVFGFALFWIASGLIGLWQLDAAAGVISGAFGNGGGVAAVLAGSLADIAIGVGLLFRRTLVVACLAAIGVSLAYLLSATVFVPSLWADPLGPLVKIFPVIGLALALMAMGEER